MKKCPPGVICLENFSIFFLIIFVGIIIYLLTNKTTKNEETININQFNTMLD